MLCAGKDPYRAIGAGWACISEGSWRFSKTSPLRLVRRPRQGRTGDCRGTGRVPMMRVLSSITSCFRSGLAYSRMWFTFCFSLVVGCAIPFQPMTVLAF